MKKLLVVIIALMCCMSIVQAQSKLTVVIKDVTNSEGKMFVGVYNDAATFIKCDPVLGDVLDAKKGVMELVIADVPEGEYAIAIFHDKNGNGKLDLGEKGLPLEKYGFSNNPKLKYGPATFDMCTFTVKEDTVIQVNLR